MKITELQARLAEILEDSGDLEVMIQLDDGAVAELAVAYADCVQPDQYPESWNMPVGWRFLRLAD